MGLFGGFKAKLIRTNPKKKQDNNVVCLRFHTLSEFRTESTPSTSNNQNENHQVIINSKIKERPKIPIVLKRKESEIESKNSEINTTKEENFTPVKLSKSTSSSSNQILKEPKSESLHPELEKQEEKENGNFAIFSSEESKNEEVPKLAEKQEDEDENFKIHFMPSNISDENFSSEESEEEEEVSSSPMNFSSQATSIFFGDFEEPKVQRPRNFLIEPDSLSNASSASA